MRKKKSPGLPSTAPNKLSAFLKVFPSLLRLVSVSCESAQTGDEELSHRGGSVTSQDTFRTPRGFWLSFRISVHPSGLASRCQGRHGRAHGGRNVWGKAPPNHSRSSSSLIRIRNNLYNLQGPCLATCSSQRGPIFHRRMLPAREQACKP